MKSIRIATRASRLALAQAEIVRRLLQQARTGLEVTLVKVTTRGDSSKSAFLQKAGATGFFTSEVERAVLDGRADIAVHSLKDLPTAQPEGLVVAAVPKRENCADAVVAKKNVASLYDLPAGATVGTSSLRRIAQIRHLRPELKTVPLRGNIETRIHKVRTGRVDAAVVAYAGLFRLGFADSVSAVLEPGEFLPAPGQGALAVQTRADDDEINEFVRGLDDESSRIAVEAERQVLRAVGGGCSVPLGVWARIESDALRINAMIAALDGKSLYRSSGSCDIGRRGECAGRVAAELLSAGGREILENIRSDADK